MFPLGDTARAVGKASTGGEVPQAAFGVEQISQPLVLAALR